MGKSSISLKLVLVDAVIQLTEHPLDYGRLRFSFLKPVLRTLENLTSDKCRYLKTKFSSHIPFNV